MTGPAPESAPLTHPAEVPRSSASQLPANMGSDPVFRGSLLLWPVIRATRAFRVYVVEPEVYSPNQHAKIFNAALTALITPESSLVDTLMRSQPAAGVENFDLITFPEAFLPQDALLEVLLRMSHLSSFGCVHVGLRPSTSEQHLFRVEELRALVGLISDIPKVDRHDLDNFSRWLGDQNGERHFNVGCIFTVDASGAIRVCLHPKLVRSKFEISPLHESHMSEADLLTLITLLPANKSYLSVTLQPLLCSDALSLDTDRAEPAPLEAVNANAGCFGDMPPDHVDIVSVATCTPQPEQGTQAGDRYRSWHQEFCDSFRRAAVAGVLSRHHYSTFVLANYRTIPGPLPGGLSGAFIPVPLRRAKHPEFVSISSWGSVRSSPPTNNSWSVPQRGVVAPENWSSLGYMASLDPFALESNNSAYMLGFTIQRLPRDTTRWRETDGFVDFQLRTATYRADAETLFFQQQEV